MEENLTSLLDELYDDINTQEVEELGINIEEEGFRIIDVNQANFFLRQLAKLQEEKKAINDMCDKEIEAFVLKVNSFRNSKLQTLENTENYFNTLLEKFAAAELADSNKKSLKLPFGTLQYRTTPAGYKYNNEEAIFNYIKSNNLNEFIRTKQDIDKTKLKKALLTKDGKVYLNGEELEDIVPTEQETKFSIKTV